MNMTSAQQLEEIGTSAGLAIHLIRNQEPQHHLAIYFHEVNIYDNNHNRGRAQSSPIACHVAAGTDWADRDLRTVDQHVAVRML